MTASPFSDASQARWYRYNTSGCNPPIYTGYGPSGDAKPVWMEFFAADGTHLATSNGPFIKSLRLFDPATIGGTLFVHVSAGASLTEAPAPFNLYVTPAKCDTVLEQGWTGDFNIVGVPPGHTQATATPLEGNWESGYWIGDVTPQDDWLSFDSCAPGQSRLLHFYQPTRGVPSRGMDFEILDAAGTIARSFGPIEQEELEIAGRTAGKTFVHVRWSSDVSNVRYVTQMGNCAPTNNWQGAGGGGGGSWGSGGGSP